MSVNRLTFYFDAMENQPRPCGLRVARFNTTTGPQTVIIRAWSPGDASRCRLCPKAHCDADGDVCAIIVPGHIAPAKAAMHRYTT